MKSNKGNWTCRRIIDTAFYLVQSSTTLFKAITFEFPREVEFLDHLN
jgi:hypothetical protein